MTRKLRYACTYWAVYEWLKYDILRSKYSLKQYIAKCLILEQLNPNWHKYAKENRRNRNE